MKLAILFSLLFAISAPAPAATYYVRSDGGTAAQCNGTDGAPNIGAIQPGETWQPPEGA